MISRVKTILTAALLCVLLPACTQSPAAETPTPLPIPSEAPAPIPTGSPTPMILAGQELASAVMLDYTKGNDGGFFSCDRQVDRETEWEETFLQWGFSQKVPFYEYHGEDGADLVFYYDELRDRGMGIWKNERGFGLIGSFSSDSEELYGQLKGAGSGWGEFSSYTSENQKDWPEKLEYDDLGRLSYGEGYITHGRYHYYYIYKGDSPIPSYLLRIDDNVGYADPLLIRYPDENIPLPLPEGSPLTLAGQELYSAIMEDTPKGRYGFSTGTAANLEGWFRLLGFQAEEPYYEYYDLDGTLRLILWYDPDSGAGLGIRYRDYGDPLETYLHGFGFRYIGWAGRDEEDERLGYGWYRWEDDPFTLPPYDVSEVPDYEERREWDEAGRLTRLASYGTLSEYWPPVKENPLPLCEFTYDYDEEGTLLHRNVFSHYTFHTTAPGQDGYYDDQGRLAYERGYITHGSTDTYYIYEGDSKKPAYVLYLDECHQTSFPQFLRYP